MSWKWSVIPIAAGTKAPCVSWKKYQQTRPTMADWEYWAWQFPGCGVAVVCGSISGVIGLDADGPEAEAWALGITNSNLDGPCVRTFRGRRWLTRIPKQTLKPWTQFFGPGVSFTVLAEGSSFILPPSRHPSGGRYSWEGKTPGLIDDFPPCPEVFQSPCPTPLNLCTEGFSYVPTLAPALRSFSSGGRNVTLFQYARRLGSLGYGPERISTAVRTMNATLSPPLEESEVARLVQNSLKYKNNY